MSERQDDRPILNFDHPRVLPIDHLPEDVRAFLQAASCELAKLPEEERVRRLVAMYPLLAGLRP